MPERSRNDRTLRLALAAGVLALLWLGVSRWAIPPLVEAAYLGRAPDVLSGLISGRDVHPLEHYQRAWRSLSRAFSVAGMSVGLLALGFTLLPTDGGLLTGHPGRTPAGTEGLVAGGTFLLAVVVCSAYGIGAVPLIGDNQHYFYMAERVADGVPPHVSNFDPKASLSLLVTGAAIGAGRLVGLGDVVSARLLSVVALGGGVSLLAVFTYRWTRHAGASLVAGLLPLALVHLPLLAVSGSRPKVFLFFFAAASLCFAASSRWGPALLAATLGSLTWQPALLLVAAVLLSCLAAGERGLGQWGRLVAGGVLLPVLLYELYFLATGALEEQLTQELLFPASYMTSAVEGPGASVRSLGRIWSSGYSPQILGVNVGPALLALTALAGLTLAFYLWRHRSSLRGAAGRQPAVPYLLLGAAGTAAFTFYDHQGPPDLFFLVPFAVPLVAGGTAVLAAGLRKRPGRPAEYVTVGIVSLVLLAAAVAGIRSSRGLGVTLSDQRRAAGRVGAWLDDGSRVYAIGSTHLLALNRASNWLPYSFFFRGVDRWLRDHEEYVGTDDAKRAYSPRRHGRLPDVVLTSRGWPQGWPGWLETRYADVTTPLFERQGVDVWRRSDGPGATGAPGPGRRGETGGR